MGPQGSDEVLPKVPAMYINSDFPWCTSSTTTWSQPICHRHIDTPMGKARNTFFTALFYAGSFSIRLCQNVLGTALFSLRFFFSPHSLRLFPPSRRGAFNCLHLGWDFAASTLDRDFAASLMEGGLLTTSTLDGDFAASLSEGGGTRSVTEGVLYEVSTCRWHAGLARAA